MEKVIYLVKGTTGDYEDTFHWIVKGFFNKEKAEKLCQDLNLIAKKSHVGEFGKNYAEQSLHHELIYKTQEEVCKELSIIDPKATVFGPGTHYSIEEMIVEVD